MAWKRCDDLDGSVEDVRSVSLGYRDGMYVLHLGPANRKLLDEALAPWLEDRTPHGPMPTMIDADPDAREPRPSSTTRAGRRAGGRNQRADMPEVRAWAATNGFALNSRGRVPGDVLRAYDARVGSGVDA